MTPMNGQRHLTTATACALTALLVTGAAGVSDVAIACVCPDGQVTIEAGAVCSCCSASSSGDPVVDAGLSFEDSPCSDCVDVPLRVLQIKNDPLQVHPETATNRCRARLPAGFSGLEADRRARPGQAHRLTLELLQSVILLT
jgi:hypothetical protein